MNQKMLHRRKILGLALITGLCLVLAGHAYAAGMGRGGGFSRGPGMTGGGMHGGKHGGGFHKGNGFHGSTCCQNGFFVGGFVMGSFFGASDVAAYPYPAYAGGPADTLSLTVQPRTQVDLAPPVPPMACYPSGCYRLRGDGVTVAYEWIWVPVLPAPPPSPPPQTPGVIQYPNGRYEQRGPSQWVWVPNPPTTPPAAPSPAPQSLAPSGSAAPIPSQYGGLYRWVDEHGVVHWTQGLQAVPERYREQARRGADG